MFRKNRQQFIEHVRRIKAEARFDGELDFHRVAQRAENGVHALGFAQQTAAGAFAINDRRGAAEIQVHGGNRIFLQLARGAHQRRNVVADHLRDDRAVPVGFSVMDLRMCFSRFDVA